MYAQLLVFGAAFLGSGVESVEALTIVLAVGLTRGWRSPLAGAAGAGALPIAPGAPPGPGLGGVGPGWPARLAVGARDPPSGPAVVSPRRASRGRDSRGARGHGRGRGAGQATDAGARKPHEVRGRRAALQPGHLLGRRGDGHLVAARLRGNPGHRGLLRPRLAGRGHAD